MALLIFHAFFSEIHKENIDVIQQVCQKCRKGDFASMTEFNDHVLECYGDALRLDVEFKCKFCPSVWNSAEVLRYHIFIEHHTPMAVCDICGMAVPTMKILTFHRERTHFTVKDTSCKICEKTFSTFSRLRTHDKLVHQKTYAYLCKQCDYKCQTSSALKVHVMSKHTANPIFHCSHCDFNAPLRGTLLKHVRRNHSKLPLKSKSKSKQKS